MCCIDKTPMFFFHWDHSRCIATLRRGLVFLLLIPGFGWTQASLSFSEQPQQQKTTVNVGTSDISTPSRPLKKLENSWGSFLPGTWVVRRTKTQQSVENSIVTNVTDTLLTLEPIDESGIRLRQETAIGIANSTFTPDPKQVLLDLHQQPFSEGVVVDQLSPQAVVVARRQVVCQVFRYSQIHGDQKKTTTLWYSDSVMPYLLRSEEIRTNLSSTAAQPETVLGHTMMTVTDTSDVRFFKNLLSEYKTQTIKKTATGTVVSQATYSMNIPGNLLREVTVETDTNNKVIGHSVTSVIDYYVACPGVPVKQRRLYSEASKEIQSNWDNIPNLDSDKLPD